MPVQELVRCHCLVTVEVGGKALHQDKKAKETGVQVVQAGTGVNLRVLGFRRDVVLSSRNLRTVVESKIAEGRLAFVSKDNMQVVLSQAQASQLHAIVKALKGQGDGGKGMVLSRGLGLGSIPGSSAPRPVATPAKVLRGTGGETASEPIQRISLGSLPEQVLKDVLSFVDPSLLPSLGEACKTLEEMTVARGSTFRLARSCSMSVRPQYLLRRVQRQTTLQLLDLTGFEGLTAGVSKDLAQVLDEAIGSCMLTSLSLRGCKAMTDASVRRLLRSCPRLKTLDLLEIPRLSNKALEVPLPALEALAVGSLGRTVVNKKATKHSERVGLMASRIDVSGGNKAMSNEHMPRPAHASLYTSSLVAQVMSPGMFEENEVRLPPEAASQAPPLTTMVLAHCADIQVLPKLPAELIHLDLRGASLQVPEAALATWKPLSRCIQLKVLNLAGNVLLTSRGISACLASLPSQTQLKVLDISDTRPEAATLAALPAQVPALTHLRLCNCMAVNKAGLGELLRGLSKMEVLDIAGTCVDYPLADLVPSPSALSRLTGGRGSSTQQVLASNLRLLGVGRTELAMGDHLEYTRRALAIMAPLAEAIPGSLDIFKGYNDLPPRLL